MAWRAGTQGLLVRGGSGLPAGSSHVRSGSRCAAVSSPCCVVACMHMYRLCLIRRCVTFGTTRLRLLSCDDALEHNIEIASLMYWYIKKNALVSGYEQKIICNVKRKRFIAASKIVDVV